MSTNKVAIILHENELVIRELAHEVHIWVAATPKNKATVEALWKMDMPQELTITHYDVPAGSTAEEMCLIAIDLVEDHHSSVFSAEPWVEIQVHGCGLTQKLTAAFKTFGNTTITKKDHGFNVKRPSE